METTEKRAAHTPGPWEIRPGRWSEGSPLHVSAEDGSRYITTITPAENRDANAHLIAAAPELLAACQAMWKVSPHNPKRAFEYDNEDFDAAQRAAAAIAKATT